MKARITELVSKQALLALKVSQRGESRDVVVECIIDAASEITQEVRKDTGEIISSRPIRDEERQIALNEAVTDDIDDIFSNNNDTQSIENTLDTDKGRDKPNKRGKRVKGDD